MLIMPAKSCGPVEQGRYPYLVIRLMAGVYQREPLDIQPGKPSIHVGHRSSSVRHPEPFNADGSVSKACRALLVMGVLNAVRRTGFRMCVVWDPENCTFVERDGKCEESATPPSGGLGTGGVGGTALPIEIDVDSPPVPVSQGVSRRS